MGGHCSRCDNGSLFLSASTVAASTTSECGNITQRRNTQLESALLDLEFAARRFDVKLAELTWILRRSRYNGGTFAAVVVVASEVADFRSYLGEITERLQLVAAAIESGSGQLPERWSGSELSVIRQSVAALDRVILALELPVSFDNIGVLFESIHQLLGSWEVIFC